MGKWTNHHGHIIDEIGDSVCIVQDSDYAARIVDCVNACEGMKDPAKEIAELREALELYVKDYDKHSKEKMLPPSAFYIIAKRALKGGQQ